jgi:diacylglycerol O-acyltransferase / wax synthase
MIEQLSDQDAGFLYLETQETPQHVSNVSLVALPAGHCGDFYEDYKRHVGSRIHLIPLLHRKLQQVPFEIDHPYWVDDDAVDLDYHIRQQTLPSPGRMDQLEELVGRLHAEFLDRSRPLWEFYVIKGLENGQLAIYTKIHHAGMDGAASQHLLATVYDPTPEPRHFPPPARGSGKAPPAGLATALRGIAEHAVRHEIRSLQFVPELLKTLSHIALPDADTLKYPKPHLPPLRPPRTLFNTAISSQRVYATRSLSLSRCKGVAKLADAKLNDVVLAVCSAALRRYLQGHGALPKATLTAMVPVSMREPGDTSSANQNAAMICSLATDIADPVQRLLAIKASTSDQKKLLANLKNLLLPDLSLVGSGLVMRGMVDLYRRAKLADRLPPTANLVISNVPGPAAPLYIAGARLLTMAPCSIPFHGQALNITVESYCDSLDFGLVACRRTVPDLAELADKLLPALDELEAAVQRQLAPAAKPGAAPAPVKTPRRRTRTPSPPPSTAKGR